MLCTPVLNSIYNRINFNTIHSFMQNTIQTTLLYQQLLSLNTKVEEKKYWMNKLASRKRDVSFPISRDVDSKLGEIERLQVKVEFSEQEIATITNVSADPQALFVLLTASLFVQLNKFLDETNLCVGTQVPDSIAQPSNNILPVVLSFNPDDSFRKVLQVTRAEYIEARKNQDYPVKLLFDKQDWLESEAPKLFNVALVINGSKNASWCDEINPDIVFDFYTKDNLIEGVITYNPAMYSSDDIGIFFKNFKTLLFNCLRNPDTPVRCIEGLAEDEKRTVLDVFNNTKAEFPHTLSIHKVFEEQVRLFPHKIAVAYNDIQLTYEELNLRADQLAAKLASINVVNSSVAILQNVGVEYIISILAVLKAGGAYVPVDTRYPTQRIKRLLKDVQTCVLLTSRSEIVNTERIEFLQAEERESVTTIFIEDVLRERKGDVNVESSNEFDNAYILFTSGSTGNPKGVLISHRNVLRLVKNTKYVTFSPDTRILLTGATTFDATTFEIWGSLLNGGILCMMDKNELMDADHLEKRLKDECINTLWLTSPFFNQLIDQAGERIFSTLEYLVIGGDALSPKHINRVRDKNNRIKIINGYGPTENTTFSLTMDIHQQYQHSIPIGKPITNSTAFILDRNLQLKPLLGWGVLYVGGEGVTKGYLNNPELTHEKLIKHPLGGEGYLYKTDDIVRLLPDYTVEFRGRTDRQIKLRGYRIELGEIEAQVAKMPGIQSCVTLVKGESESKKQLFLYFTGSEEITAVKCRSYLSEMFPEYMVPQHIVQLDHFPLTAHGKLDTRALPETDNSETNDLSQWSEYEKRVGLLWASVLSIDVRSLLLTSNFFERGGHSLHSIALLSKIQTEFGVKVSIAQLFRNPTLGELSACIRSSKKSSLSTIKRAEKREYYPSSSAQKRMFILQQLDASNTAYNIVNAAVLPPSLSVADVNRIFRELIQRHESLRTGFISKEGNVYQKVRDEVEFEIEINDHPSMPLEDTVQSFIKPFDLAHPPLVRACVKRTQEGKNVLLLDMHHIISDGVSQEVLLSEFTKIINHTALAECKFQYKDIAQWQHGLLYRKMINEQELFWLKEFQNDIPVLTLSTDFERPRVKRYDGETIHFLFDEAQTTLIAGFCKQHEVTLHMFLLASWAVTISKYAAQDNLVIGTPVTGRFQQEMQSVIGMFVNTLAIRCLPQSNKSFKEYLNEIRTTMLSALENQSYPFEELIDKLVIPRDTSRNPLFDVAFNLLRSDQQLSLAESNNLGNVSDLQRIAKFDLSLTAIEAEQCVRFSLEYASSLFKAETVNRMIESFTRVVNYAVNNPANQISEITHLSDREYAKLTTGFNAYVLPLPNFATIQEAIRKISSNRPDVVALQDDFGSITYQALEDSSDRVCAYLIKEGVCTNTVVAVSMKNKKEMVLAMLGILKAGCAFLPFDPTLPDNRIEQMLSLAGVSHIITQQELTSKFQNLARVHFIEDIAMHRHIESINRPSENLLAYIIFTSGTTGVPNGVKVEHRALINLCEWHCNYYGITSTDRATKYASLSFDATIWEIFPYLYSGASVHFVGREEKYDVQLLNLTFLKQGITIAFLPTQIGEKFTVMKNTSLKKLLVGGDRLKHLDLTNNKYDVYNNYGPTENTVVTTACKIDTTTSTYPIGKPIANAKVVVLKQGTMELSPIQVPGELCISGESLAAGYLNEETTATSFVSSPFFKGERMYRTGDLVRWLPDGNLEFLGRMNDQIKIRGYRIELAEVEAQVAAIPGILESVVVACIADNGDNFLCAYYTALELQSSDALKSNLKARLPEYMIPLCFVQLDRMPVTNNGKIDKRALPKPVIESGVRYTAPETDIEATLVSLWAEVLCLNKDKIGINDNFFDLGGNSLRAIHLKEKIVEVLMIEITVVSLFEYTSIKSLAEFITQGDTQKQAEKVRLELTEQASLDVLTQTLFSINS